MQQFETLLSQFGGPVEKDRWRQLLATITVVPAQGQGAQMAQVGRAAQSRAEDTAGAEAEAQIRALSAASTAPAGLIAHEGIPCADASAVPPHGEAFAAIEAKAPSTEAAPSGAQAAAESTEDEAPVALWPDRVARLERLSACAKAVLGLGDAAHALTLTANSRAVQTAALQGVLLETHVHRAAWLTGI